MIILPETKPMTHAPSWLPPPAVEVHRYQGRAYGSASARTFETVPKRGYPLRGAGHVRGNGNAEVEGVRRKSGETALRNGQLSLSGLLRQRFQHIDHDRHAGLARGVAWKMAWEGIEKLRRGKERRDLIPVSAAFECFELRVERPLGSVIGLPVLTASGYQRLWKRRAPGCDGMRSSVISAAQPTADRCVRRGIVLEAA